MESKRSQKAASSVKGVSPVGRGRGWSENIKSLSSRWADALEDEMDFSVPPQPLAARTDKGTPAGLHHTLWGV
jgi:hypothetical protein